MMTRIGIDTEKKKKKKKLHSYYYWTSDEIQIW